MKEKRKHININKERSCLIETKPGAKGRAKFTRTRSLWNGLGLALVVLPLLVGLSVSSQEAFGQTAAGWSEPRRLLPYTKSPRLIVDPVRQSVTYVTSSGAYGVIVGDELINWQNETYTKIGDQGTAQDVSATYDEFGTLHVVWAARTSNGEGGFNVFYNRILKGSNNVGIYRNLTKELIGTDAYTGQPYIAYSPQQKKLFLLYMERGEGIGTSVENPIWFSESGDQGTSWSKPQKLGAIAGYNPSPPNLIVDKAGNPHIFYGFAKPDDSGGYVYHRMRVNGSWSGSEDIVRDTADNGRIFSNEVKLADNGDLYFTWSNGNINVARWEAASGQWKNPSRISKGGFRGNPTVAIGSNNTVWLAWNYVEFSDDQRTEFSVSTDSGASWKPNGVAIRNKDTNLGRSFGISATSSKGKIYLVVTADQLDPRYIQFPSLFLTTIGESNVNPPPPTSNPNGTLPPLPSATVSITTTSGTPTTVTSTPTPTATISPSPSASVTPGLQGDEYEPDSSLTEAMAHSRYLQSGKPETHTLYDPRPSDHRDTDIVLIQAEKGKSYKIEVVANGFQPKLSFYRYEGGEFLGASNECQGDQRRLCWLFTPDKDGLYYAQFTNFNGGAGNPNLVYTLSLKLDVAVSPSPAVSPSLSPSLSPSPEPSATSIATTSATLSPTTTTAATATSQPTRAPTATNTATAQPAASAAPTQPPPAPQLPPVTPEPTATATPQPTLTLPPEAAQATANAQAQIVAAQTPQVLIIPIAPDGSGGRGPQLLPATPTLKPTFTPGPTATARPTATVSAATSTATPAVISPIQNETQGQKAPLQPPPTGAFWLLPAGLVLVGKGLLNLLAARARL